MRHTSATPVLPDAVVFPVLHGPFGEDGVIQGHLEALNVPYVGAGVLSSAICMDKGVCQVGAARPRPPGGRMATGGLSRTWGADVMERGRWTALGLPMFVKPANLGSSIGVAKVTDLPPWATPCCALSSSTTTWSSRNTSGDASSSSPSWATRTSGCHKPARSSPAASSTTSTTSTCSALAETVAPTDLKRRPAGRGAAVGRGRLPRAARRGARLASTSSCAADDRVVVINEVNTMPGFTPISMFPMLWEAEGVSFRPVVEELIVLAEARHTRRRMLRTHRVV